MAVSFGKKGQKPVKKEAKKEAKAGAELVFQQLQKEHGQRVVTHGHDIIEAERIPLGIFPFDLATGGGIPKGRMTVFKGPEGGAKSLHLYKALAAVQKRGEKAVLVEPEHVFDRKWGARIAGLDLESLIVVSPDNGEQAVDAVEAFLYAHDVGMVGIDSIASLTPNNTIESDASKMAVAGNAMLVTKLSNKIMAALSREAKNDHHPAVVAINQIRNKIGVMFGNPESNPGGFAFGHATSLRVRFYGKNILIKEVHPTLSTYKHIDAVVEKWRIPIVGQSFEYDMAVLEHTKSYGDDLDIDMRVGDVDAVDTVMDYLAKLGMMKKVKAGYTVLSQTFKTQKLIELAYRQDADFSSAVNEEIWSRAKGDFGQSIIDGEISDEVQKAMTESS